MTDHSDAMTARERQVAELAARETAARDADARRREILAQVHNEREAQDDKWGGADHDDRHKPGDWTRFIVRQLGAAEEGIDVHHWDEWRRQMVQVAALAVAALETIDRKRAVQAAKDDGEDIPF